LLAENNTTIQQYNNLTIQQSNNLAMLLEIDFIQYKNKLRIRKTSERIEIYDPVRRRYFMLQPEEMVRQLVIQFLLLEKNYPLSKMRSEMGLTVNGMMKRCDILIFDKNLNPFFLIECKSAKIAINQDVFDQIARYNLSFKVPYLMVTNGMATFCCKMNYDTEGYEFLEQIPYLVDSL
jgi:Type I restriction enzyme R protein N terminus (HSDR_N)